MPHHLLDVVDPNESFSAADYARLGRQALADIAARGRLAIVAGGTGLYLRALLEGLFEGPARDEALRRRLEGLADRFGEERLHRLLRRADPVAAAAHPAPGPRARGPRPRGPAHDGPADLGPPCRSRPRGSRGST